MKVKKMSIVFGKWENIDDLNYHGFNSNKVN